jgi:hypothetical protein
MLLIIVSIVLIVHGLVHLMGTTVYLKLGTIEGFSYKTTLLNGRWDLGETGIAVFGALWAVAAVGFVIAGVALLAGWSWWQPVLVGVTLFSLALTVLDWKTAFAGAIINIAILVVLWLGPQLSIGFLDKFGKG